MPQSIFYVISYLALLSGIFMLHKSGKKLSALIWIAMSVMTSFAVQAVGAGIFYLAHLSISIMTVGIWNSALAVLIWIDVIKNGSQKYYIDKADALAFFIMFLVAGVIFSKRFALGHDISFASMDSATTYGIIKTMVFEHRSLTNMFFSIVTSALPMEAGLPITGEFYMYRTFLLWEIGYFFMSGVFFYILISSFLKTKGLKIYGVVGAVIYMLGYPLYSLIFGFSYFGLSISLIAYIIYAAILLVEDEFDKINVYLMLNFGLAGLFLCYMLFVPAIFTGVLAGIAVKMKREKKLFSGKTVKTGLLVFLVPSIYGLLITASNLLFISGDTVTSGTADGSRGIAMDGGCYNDMYSNFIMLMPFIIAGIMMSIRKQKDKSEDADLKGAHIVLPSVFVVMLIFAAVMFFFAMKGYVSVYYYVKNNNVFALLAWAFVMITASEMWEKAKEIFIGFEVVLLILIVMILTGADAKINEKNDRFLRVGAESFLDIYYFNEEFVKYSGDINSDDIALMEYVRYNIETDKEETEILAVGGFIYTHWFAKLTDNEVAQLNDVNQVQSTDFRDYKYICIQNTDIYDSNKVFFDNLGNVIYSNTRGKVIEMR